mgnify:CR=1 FL=1
MALQPCLASEGKLLLFTPSLFNFYLTWIRYSHNYCIPTERKRLLRRTIAKHNNI